MISHFFYLGNKIKEECKHHIKQSVLNQFRRLACLISSDSLLKWDL